MENFFEQLFIKYPIPSWLSLIILAGWLLYLFGQLLWRTFNFVAKTKTTNTYFPELVKRFKIFQSNLEAIKNDVSIIKTDLGNVKLDLGNVKLDLGNVKTELGNVKLDLATVKTDISNVKFDLDQVKSDLNKSITPTLQKTAERVFVLWTDRFGGSENESPRRLTTKGYKIIKESGLKKAIEDSLPQLYEKVKTKNPINQLRVYQNSLAVLQDLKKDPKTLNQLEIGAYQSGVDDVDALLFFGSLYLRDKLLPKFGFK